MLRTSSTCCGQNLYDFLTQANSLLLAVQGDESHCKSLAEDFKSIKSKFDVKLATSQAQRVALVNSLVYYGLLVFCYLPQKELKLDLIIELFFDEKNASWLQLGDPSILRYLVFVFILSYEKKTGRLDWKTISNVQRSEVYAYSDEVSSFIDSLYVNFDLETAAKQVAAVGQAASNDLIFSRHATAVLEYSRKMYFEVYCKVYNRVDFDTVSKFIHQDVENAEIWIVNLLRRNNIAATITKDGKSLDIGGQTSDESENLNKKAKELMSRHRIILNNATKFIS